MLISLDPRWNTQGAEIAPTIVSVRGRQPSAGRDCLWPCRPCWSWGQANLSQICDQPAQTFGHGLETPEGLYQPGWVETQGLQQKTRCHLQCSFGWSVLFPTPRGQRRRCHPQSSAILSSAQWLWMPQHREGGSWVCNLCYHLRYIKLLLWEVIK